MYSPDSCLRKYISLKLPKCFSVVDLPESKRITSSMVFTIYKQENGFPHSASSAQAAPTKPELTRSQLSHKLSQGSWSTLNHLRSIHMDSQCPQFPLTARRK